MPRSSPIVFFALAPLLGCSGWEVPPNETATLPPIAPAEPESSCPGVDIEGTLQPSGYPVGLHVAENRIVDSAGNTIVLRGVNRSGSEYRCLQRTPGFFDGPSDAASVHAIKSWNVNAVRVPLNETCWLGINGAPEAFSGCAYKKAIKDYVALLHQSELIPILELHWAAPGANMARRLQPMPNLDHSADFWRDVAETFKNDDGVVFEPYNEPFPDSNRDSDAAWRCWRDGCTAYYDDEFPATYDAIGFQALVDAIRETGAKNLILLGGVQYSNAMTQWQAYLPHDPLGNLGAAWHVYNYNSCVDASCWDGAPKALLKNFPLVVTEFGQDDCTGNFVDLLLKWLEPQRAGYLAWSWNAYGPCRPAGSAMRGSPWSLVTDYVSATPNSEYARTVYDHLLAVPP